MKRKDTRELLQFCRDKTCTSYDAHENFEDDFVNIPNVIMKIDYKRFRNWLYNKNTIEYLNYIGSKVVARIPAPTSSKDEKFTLSK